MTNATTSSETNETVCIRRGGTWNFQTYTSVVTNRSGNGQGGAGWVVVIDPCVGGFLAAKIAGDIVVRSKTFKSLEGAEKWAAGQVVS